MGAGEGAAGGGWEILAGGFGRDEREYAERGKIIWPRGWAVSDFLLSLWHARHNRAFAQPPNLPHRHCTGTAQGLRRDCTGRKDGQRINIIQYFYVRFFWLRITQ